jgi:hypothetical protein
MQYHQQFKKNQKQNMIFRHFGKKGFLPKNAIKKIIASFLFSNTARFKTFMFDRIY